MESLDLDESDEMFIDMRNLGGEHGHQLAENDRIDAIVDQIAQIAPELFHHALVQFGLQGGEFIDIETISHLLVGASPRQRV